MAALHIESNTIGHAIQFDGNQEEVTALLAMAILGSARLHNLILDALDAQEYLKEKGCKAMPVECAVMIIDNNETVN